MRTGPPVSFTESLKTLAAAAKSLALELVQLTIYARLIAMFCLANSSTEVKALSVLGPD